MEVLQKKVREKLKEVYETGLGKMNYVERDEDNYKESIGKLVNGYVGEMESEWKGIREG